MNEHNINPEEDGVTHINVYSNGKNKLGKFLSNFARTPFYCADGYFLSIESYWYWLGCPGSARREELRLVYGFAAKKLGRELRSEDWNDTPEFKEKILAAIKEKIEMSPDKKVMLQQNKLPFKHYYLFQAKDHVIVHDETEKCQWMLDYFDSFKLAQQF